MFALVAMASALSTVMVPAADAATTRWSRPTLIDPVQRGLAAISCTSASFCVAVDEAGTALAYNGSTWRGTGRLVPDETHTARIASVSCVGASFCIATDANHNGSYRFDGTGWTSANTGLGDDAFGKVTCVSTTFCLMTDAAGQIYRWNGTAWAARPDWPQVRAISCVSTTFCLAIDGNHTLIFDGTAWTASTELPTGTLTDISCVTPEFCMVVGPNPAGTDGVSYSYLGARTYAGPSIVDRAHPDVASVSCSSPTLCLAGDRDGYAIRWDGSSWMRYAVGAPLRSVYTACTSGEFCALTVGAQVRRYIGNLFTKPIQISRTQGGLRDLSCSSPTFCVAVDQTGHALTRRSSWSPPVVIDRTPSVDLPVVSCATSLSCLTLKGGKFQWWDGTSWTPPAVVPVSGFAAGYAVVSCPSADYCLVIDDAGHSASFDGAAWHAVARVPSISDVEDLSCASAAYCLVFGFDSSVNARTYAFGGSTWTATSPPAGASTGAISCPTRGRCAAVGGNLAVAPNGVTVSSPSTFSDLDCATVSFCVAIDVSNAAYVFKGTTWRNRTPLPANPPAGLVTRISCPSVGFCVAMAQTSQVWTTTP